MESLSGQSWGQNGKWRLLSLAAGTDPENPHPQEGRADSGSRGCGPGLSVCVSPRPWPLGTVIQQGTFIHGFTSQVSVACGQLRSEKIKGGIPEINSH